MYGRTTKVFFGFMAFIMVVGYPVLLLTALPSFQSLFLGQQSAASATESQVEGAREKVLELDCGDTKSPPKGDDLKKCKSALEELGAGYKALSYPTEQDQVEGTLPANSDEKLDKSLEAFQLLVRVDPDDKDSQELLGSAYAQLGKNERALEIYQQLLDRNPENVDLIFAMANTAQQAGKKDQAIAAYEDFIKLAPEDQRAETAQEQITQLENPEQPGLGGAGGSMPINIG